MRFTKALPVLALLIPGSMWAVTDAGLAPKLVLERYLSAQSQGDASSRNVVLEIEANLPNKGKSGRLRAVRHAVPFGKPEYEVLESEGDQTVRRQIIARYLTAEAQTAPSTVAVTATNYKFRYLGSVGFGSELTYVYQVTPKKRRVGLFRGELWIDANTAAVSHKSGRMVKMPSVFLRRIDIAQDTDARGGAPEARITRVDIDTRIAGRAELTIREWPEAELQLSADAGAGQ